MLKRLHFDDRESWLAGRGQGIGGSDAAAVVGVSPWMSPIELWKVKMGMTRQKDLTGNAAVEQGNRMEPILRELYAKLHPEYRVEYHQFDILFQEERPWLFVTLDGELISENGRRGILEIKTATPGAKWSQWKDGAMPQNYYCQVLHALLATGYDFVRLYACLYSQNGDMTLTEREIERADVIEDMNWLLNEEQQFWKGYVERGVMPPMRLVL